MLRNVTGPESSVWSSRGFKHLTDSIRFLGCLRRSNPAPRTDFMPEQPGRQCGERDRKDQHPYKRAPPIEILGHHVPTSLRVELFSSPEVPEIPGFAKRHGEDRIARRRIPGAYHIIESRHLLPLFGSRFGPQRIGMSRCKDDFNPCFAPPLALFPSPYAQNFFLCCGNSIRRIKSKWSRLKTQQKRCTVEKCEEDQMFHRMGGFSAKWKRRGRSSQSANASLTTPLRSGGYRLSYLTPCGQGQNRTGDTRLFRPLLYRLSYLSKYFITKRCIATGRCSPPERPNAFSFFVRSGGYRLSYLSKYFITKRWIATGRCSPPERPNAFSFFVRSGGYRLSYLSEICLDSQFVEVPPPSGCFKVLLSCTRLHTCFCFFDVFQFKWPAPTSRFYLSSIVLFYTILDDRSNANVPLTIFPTSQYVHKHCDQPPRSSGTRTDTWLFPARRRCGPLNPTSTLASPTHVG